MNRWTAGPFLLVASLALNASVTVSAQALAPEASKARSPLVIQVGVDLVQIDAAITDKQGRPVTDLRPEDFTVEVDGKKQPVTNAMFFDLRPSLNMAERDAAFVSAAAAALSSPDLTLVFLVDDLNISFSSMYSARRAMKTFAEGFDAREAKMGLTSTSDETGTIRLSRSPQRFAEAVDRVRYGFRSSKGASSAPVFSQESSSAGGLNGPRLTVDLSPLTNNPAMDRTNVEQRVFSLLSTINALRSVPGRKALVFVSEGFNIGGGADQMGVRSPFDALFGDGPDDTQHFIRMITEVANRASVVIYTIDPSGLVSDMPGIDVARPSPGSRRAAWFERVGRQGTLQQLAGDTGGLSVFNQNDLRGGLNEVVADQRAYYLIGFEPPKAAFSKDATKASFHRIKLTVHRPDVRVRTRAGFYGVTDEEVIGRAPLTALAPTY
jgi:VWFA-related protein